MCYQDSDSQFHDSLIPASPTGTIPPSPQHGCRTIGFQRELTQGRVAGFRKGGIVLQGALRDPAHQAHRAGVDQECRESQRRLPALSASEHIVWQCQPVIAPLSESVCRMKRRSPL